MKTTIAALCLLTLFSPVCVSAADTIADWKYHEDASNQDGYRTTKAVPKDAEIRIKIVKKGSSGAPQLWPYIKGPRAGYSSRVDNWTEDASEGQVLKHKMRSGHPVFLAVGGSNYWESAKGLEAKEGYHQMRFAGGWVLDVKVVGGDF